MKALRCIAMLLMVIGSLNWGLVGFFQYDLISDIFGGMSTGLARLCYALVGLAGLYGISMICCKSCSCCNGSGSCSSKKGK